MEKAARKRHIRFSKTDIDNTVFTGNNTTQRTMEKPL